MKETDEDRELNVGCTDTTQFPICPHCGHEHRDTYCDMNEGVSECNYCGKYFELQYVMCHTTEKIVSPPTEAR